MSVGLGLLRKLILEKRSLSFLHDSGVTADYFEDEEVDIYKFVGVHFRKYGETPELKTVERSTKVKFAKFPNETIGYWMDGVRERKAARIILDHASDMRKSISVDDLPKAIEQARSLTNTLQRTGMTSERVIELRESVDDVLKEHDERQRRGVMSGVPFGVPYLDTVSDGAQPEDTVALVGRPGAGKSYILLMMALSAYLAEEIPLFLSMEMSITQCARRMIALHSGVTATLIRLGRLSVYARDILVQKFETMDKAIEHPFYFLQGSLNSTVEDLADRLHEIRPTVLYVDGAYLLRTASKSVGAKWEKVAETAEYLKMIAREFKIPVIATYQFNRRGPGSLGNIAYSDVIGQLASIACGIDDEDTDETRGVWSARSYKLLMLLKGREGEKGVVRMLYDMERMKIEQREVLKGYTLDDEEF